jgi:hypothetical protein
MTNRLPVIKTVKRAVSVLGGPKATAMRFGRAGHQAAVNWVRRGAIPAALRPMMDAALEEKGYCAHPSIYTRDTLHSVASTRRI